MPSTSDPGFGVFLCLCAAGLLLLWCGLTHWVCSLRGGVSRWWLGLLLGPLGPILAALLPPGQPPEGSPAAERLRRQREQQDEPGGAG